MFYGLDHLGDARKICFSDVSSTVDCYLDVHDISNELIL